jgi:hypothetical protein
LRESETRDGKIAFAQGEREIGEGAGALAVSQGTPDRGR